MNAGLFISASGLSNSITRQSVTANNVANLNTNGFKAGRAESAALPGGGAAVTNVSQSTAQGPLVPAAGADVRVGEGGIAGYVEGSNVNLVEEQTNSVVNLRGGQANASALGVQDEMLGTVLDLLG